MTVEQSFYQQLCRSAVKKQNAIFRAFLSRRDIASLQFQLEVHLSN